jgi:hypothetical protein
MPITGSGPLVVSTAPSFSTIVDPIYTAVNGAGIAGFVLGNPSTQAVSVTIYRDNLLSSSVIWSGVVAAGASNQQVLLTLTLSAGETIWAIGAPGGIVTLEVDGLTSVSTGALSTNQLLLALLLMFADAFGVEIPSSTDLNPLSYSM